MCVPVIEYLDLCVFVSLQFAEGVSVSPQLIVHDLLGSHFLFLQLFLQLVYPTHTHTHLLHIAEWRHVLIPFLYHSFYLFLMGDLMQFCSDKHLPCLKDLLGSGGFQE